ncbi:hypothetical protein EVAR_63246_1 [Eumeta japonica]|uniref:Uncharacterized protein n=1 Tax=Eumeta variegata TaxID=151549 RepID=A0A4C1Z8A5_EUMVA|nr:hypothetical protein EVAR_63246_1 [Eumeta japonica]
MPAVFSVEQNGITNTGGERGVGHRNSHLVDETEKAVTSRPYPMRFEFMCIGPRSAETIREAGRKRSRAFGYRA